MNSQTRPIDRFIRVILDEIEQTASHHLDQPFTVAEIYQTLIPYRTHRDRLGVEMNGDYEDTLLRLLAGEGDFLVLESEAARTRIRHELSQSNPNTSIYREFAAVGVSLNPEHALTQSTPASSLATKKASLQSSVEALGNGDTPGTPKTEEALASREKSTPSHLPPAPSGKEKRPSARPSKPQEGEKADVSSCPGCAMDLPQRDTLRFCPHCGTNVLLAPCGQCGEILERSWKYCLSCGTAAN